MIGRSPTVATNATTQAISLAVWKDIYVDHSGEKPFACTQCKYSTIFTSVSVFSDLFHEGLHDGTTSNAQDHELVRSRPVVMLKLKYYCHIKYVGNQFCYIAHEKYNCHQNH